MTAWPRGLRKAGVTKGDRLGVLGKNSLEYFLVYGAAAALGAIVLAVNWRLSAEEVCFNLNDGTPVALFVDQEYQELITDNKSQLPSVNSILQPESRHGRILRLLLPCWTMRKVLMQRPRRFRSSDGLVIIHTAAVAGRPRGALLSHNNVLCANMHLIHLFNMTTRDVHLNLLPMFHIAGLGNDHQLRFTAALPVRT